MSSQSGSQKALIEKERHEMANEQEEELAELAALYRAKDSARKPQASSPRNSQPWHASFASAVVFTIGAALPMLAILLPRLPSNLPGLV